jgi:hypothetical protein
MAFCFLPVHTIEVLPHHQWLCECQGVGCHSVLPLDFNLDGWLSRQGLGVLSCGIRQGQPTCGPVWGCFAAGCLHILL